MIASKALSGTVSVYLYISARSGLLVYFNLMSRWCVIYGKKYVIFVKFLFLLI